MILTVYYLYFWNMLYTLFIWGFKGLVVVVYTNHKHKIDIVYNLAIAIKKTEKINWKLNTLLINWNMTDDNII